MKSLYRTTVVAVLLLVAFVGTAYASIEVYSLAFRKSIPTASNYNDSTETDNSGYLQAFIRNTGTTNVSFTPASYESGGTSDALKVNGQWADALQSDAFPTKVRWWRIYPTTLKPGEVGCVTLKSKDSSWISEGKSCTVEVRTTAGETASITGNLNTPDIRISDVIPSPDRRTLYIYVRNVAPDDPNPANDVTFSAIDRVDINKVNITSQCTILGGAMGVKGIAIIKVQYVDPVASRELLNVEVRAVRATPSVANIWAKGSIRLVDSGFPIGTWSTALPENPWYSKNLGINVGCFDWDYRITDRFHTSFIRGAHNEYLPKRLDFDFLHNNARNLGWSDGAWYVGEEPDNSPRASYEYSWRNTYYWNNTYNAPTFLCICKSKKANEWAGMADISGIDQYAFGGAPNQISFDGPWQTLEYAECLKANAEPVRVWNWSQLAFNEWSSQSPTWGIDYQFWANVFAGAKGVLHFRYAPTNETGSNPDQIAEGVKLFKKLNMVRWAALYSAPTDSSWINTGTDVRTRALVGEKAALVVVLNDTYTNSSHSPRTGSVKFRVPSYIPLEVVKKVGENSFTTLANGTDYTLAGRLVTINFNNLDTESFVYYIGANDVTSPSAPTGINVVSRPDLPSNTYEVSFNDARDDVGIYRYRIYVNGVQAATSRITWCDVVVPDPVNDIISVKAEDSSGNLSDAATYKLWQWKFDLDNHREMWRKSSNLEDLEVKNGKLMVDVEAGEWCDIDLFGEHQNTQIRLMDPGVFGVLHVRMANYTSCNEGKGTYYNGSAWINLPTFTTIPDSGMRDYYIKLVDTAGWTYGTNVMGIRFRPANSDAINGRVDIDSMEFLPYYSGAPTAPGQPSTGITATNIPSITWTWTPSSADAPNSIAYYKVVVNDGSSNVLETLTPNANAAFTFTEPQVARGYRLRCWAYDTSGNVSAVSLWSGYTYYDTVAPTKPQNLTATAVSGGNVALSWDASTDGQGPLAGYNIYRDGAFLASVGPARITYNDTNVERGITYTYRVSAIDYVPLESAQSTPAQATTPDPKIGDAKKLGVATADMGNDIVTVITSDGFYMQEPDRTAGIRVISTQPVTVGNRVDVYGTISTDAKFERVITANTVGIDITNPLLNPAEPFFMLNRFVGGVKTPEYVPGGSTGQAGVFDPCGPNNIGLLVKVTGVVAQVGTGWFYINDGSRAFDFSGYEGIRVICPGYTLTKTGLISVTGISSIYVDSGVAYRCILLRDPAEIRQY